MMSQVHKVSIIITCFNDWQFIRQAIESARKQRWLNKEIIVIDDGSGQKTREILESLASHIDILHFQENKGVSKARNKAIGMSNGEYILIWDADDYFEPEFIETAIEWFRNDSSIKLITSYSRWFNDGDGKSKLYKPRGGDLESFLLNNGSLGTIFRKQNWEKVGGYDENMLDGYEDWEFYIRMLAQGGKAEVIPEILFHYRNRSNSRNKKANQKKYEILEYIYQKHEEKYKEYFVSHSRSLLKQIKDQETAKFKYKNSLEYRLGAAILKPFHLLKSKLQKK